MFKVHRGTNGVPMRGSVRIQQNSVKLREGSKAPAQLPEGMKRAKYEKAGRSLFGNIVTQMRLNLYNIYR